MKIRTPDEPEQRVPVVRAYLGDIRVDGVIADNFAGGGGASTGIELALGRSPDLAVNHDAEAIAMHVANHPGTRHYIEDVFAVSPVEACGGRPCALAWFSPDCKHHSKAKGGKPRDAKIRGLAWVAVKWAEAVRPRVIALENVEEFLDWGPLAPDGQPIKARKGETFAEFVGKLRELGYAVEWRLLRACDFGAPTTRRRLFLVARCDGAPIAWPEPTHGPDRAAPYRTAAEIIDWTIPCPSIFDRARPLAANTEARIARGIRKFVIEPSAAGARPFIVPTAHAGDARVHDLELPLPTVAVPYLVHRSNGERKGQAPRIYDVQRPIGTIVAQGQKHAACIAWLVKHYGGNESTSGGSDLRRAIDTVTAQDHHSLAVAHVTKLYGTSTGSSAEAPLPTVTAGGGKGGGHLGAVVAFLARYNGTGDAESVTRPLGTVTTRDRFALATVTIDGEDYQIVDIGMRMLTPRELFRAQGFSDDYRIDAPGPNGKPLTKTAQIRMCGNSVCPPLAAAVVRAQFAATAW